MYACEHYFTESLLEKMKACSVVIIVGLSVGMCNVVSYLQSINFRNLAVCDLLFDTNPHIRKFRNVPVIAARQAFKQANAFYILTEFSDESAERDRIQISNLHEDAPVLRIVSSREIRLEASGICNLHCMSCQCGNYDPAVFSFSGRSFLPLSLCERILDKLKTEYPDNMGIFYYIFGEPFLHPQLDKLVNIAKQKGLSVVLSSNFSFQKDLIPVVQAKPDILKISLSGSTDEIYQRHHQGGSIQMVHENMKKLNVLLQSVSEICVVVGYHIYRDNQGEEMEYTRKLCEQYGWLFAPVPAIYNNPLKRMGICRLTDADRKFLKTYYEHPEDYLALYTTEEQLDKKCRNIENKLFIDYDGNIMLCELLHHDAVYQNYLDVSRKMIYQWRKSHALCIQCRKHGLCLI